MYSALKVFISAEGLWGLTKLKWTLKNITDLTNKTFCYEQLQCESRISTAD